MTTTFIVSSLLLFAVLVFLIFWYFLSPDVRYNKNEAEQQKKATEGEDAALREEVVMLRERVRNLQKLIDEKERTIRILSRRASFDSASRLDEMA